MTARAADGTVIATTNLLVNILPPISPGAWKNVCARYGEAFDTGPRAFGNVYGSPRFEAWWNSSPTTLPGWLVLDPATGRLSGTAPGYDYRDYFEPRLYDTLDNAYGAGADGGRQFFEVYAPLSLAPPANLTMTELAYYDGSMRASGGNYNQSFSVADGTLPPGISMRGNGAFAGTPALASDGTAPLTYTARIRFDPNTCGAPPMFRDVTFTVNPAIRPYAQIPATMYFRQGLLSRSPDGVVVGKGPESYRWSENYIEVPGLSVDAGAGAVYGIATQPGIKTGRSVRANNKTTDAVLISNDTSVVVLPPPTLVMPATNRAVLGQAVRITPVATGFVGVLAWSSNGLPPGLSVDQSDGSVVGTPTRAGSFATLAVRATEQSSPGVDTSGNPFPPAGVTSNAFSIELLAPPTVSGVSDLAGQTNAQISMSPAVSGVVGQASWAAYGDVPAGFSVDPSTGAFSGRSNVPANATLQLSVTDSASGLSATSAYFRLSVTDPVPPAKPARWTWDGQICVYGKGDGTFAGRQLQTCAGDGCPAPQRGCAVPFSGGESSYPKGLAATDCADPTLPPNDMFCPTSQAGGTWLYAPKGTVPNNAACITVTSYALGCYPNGSTQPSPDTSSCGPAPTAIASCKLNDKGVGTCAPGVAYTDNTSYNGFDDGSTWSTANFCAPQGSIRWAYQWISSGIGPNLFWGYTLQCTKDRYKAGDGLCGPRPSVPSTCYQGMTNVTVKDSTCPQDYPRFHTYRMQGCLLGACPLHNSAEFDYIPGP